MKTILIVDDDVTLQTALTRRLQGQGFRVMNATSAAEGLTLFEEGLPDVVVSDILMPQMDGFEFCRRIRANPLGELVPFIFLSCLGEVESRIQGHTLGADDYLVKPFHAQELIAKINSLIERSNKIQAQVQRLVQGTETPTIGLQDGGDGEQADTKPEPLPLTPAEAKVFWEAVQGYTNKQIGERLFISPRTVQTHLSNILSKLSLGNRSQLIRFAFERGYRSPQGEMVEP